MKRNLPSQTFRVVIKMDFENVIEVLRVARDSHEPVLSGEKGDW